MVRLLAVVALLFAFLGCMLLENPGAGLDGGTCGTPDGGGCNELTPSQFITMTNIPAFRPDAGGGVIADGIYDLVEAHVFTGPAGGAGPTITTYESVYRFCGSGFETAGRLVTDAEVARRSGSYGVAPATARIELLTTCGDPQGKLSGEYTVNGNTLTLYSGEIAEVFTRR
jgi:hypothetical protein